MKVKALKTPRGNLQTSQVAETLEGCVSDFEMNERQSAKIEKPKVNFFQLESQIRISHLSEIYQLLRKVVQVLT